MTCHYCRRSRTKTRAPQEKIAVPSLHSYPDRFVKDDFQTHLMDACTKSGGFYYAAALVSYWSLKKLSTVLLRHRVVEGLTMYFEFKW
ncbi:hypothetical protein CEXT_799551 [Caerostris extrusa]|uniref:Uncharacterized protein n=1 Tax=Caerostris extrusa TaxID=172846 RepID=A0AAV4XJ00_CAEEX|nr:hypothetical protein CEXT_799551 [Caerostris extrusa]